MPKNLLLSFRKIFSSTCLLYLILINGGGICFAQEPSDTGSKPSEQVKVEEDHDTKDLEDLLKKYNTDQIKVIEDNSKLQNIDAQNSENEKLEQEIEALANAKRIEFVKGKKKAEEKITIDDKLSNSIKIALEPLQQLSDKELKERFIDASKQTKFYPYLEKFPKAIVFGTSLIKDREAIPNLIKILEDKKRLVTFGGIMVMTIIVGLALKKLFYNEKRSFLGVIFFFFLRVYTMLFLRIGIVYYFFSKELSPTIEVFKKVFL